MEKIVIGYHGTRLNYVENILADGFKLSRNEYDWLGDGIYFFQDGKKLAEEWCSERYGNNGVVIGAKIDLSDCLDLVDSKWSTFLKKIHDELVEKLQYDKSPIPYQSEGAHRLDRAVINYAIKSLAASGNIITTVRASFNEGDPLYPNSALLTKSHIQIAVREKKCNKRNMARK